MHYTTIIVCITLPISLHHVDTYVITIIPTLAAYTVLSSALVSLIFGTVKPSFLSHVFITEW